MVERIHPRENAPSLPSIPTAVDGIPTTAGVDELHELRVRIPVNLHRQLLSLKVLRGRSLAETVSLALDNYFSQVRSPSTQQQAESPEEKDEPAHT